MKRFDQTSKAKKLKEKSGIVQAEDKYSRSKTIDD